MYWQEKEDKNGLIIPEDVVDYSFRIKCAQLPLDHAHALSTGLRSALPWLDDEDRAAIHLIHVAESGNGWMRPEDPETEILNLSRRTRLTIRVPGHRIEDIQKLEGLIIDIEGNSLEIGAGQKKLLSNATTIFSRYVVSSADESENEFIERQVGDLKSRGITVRKLMCGRISRHKLPEEQVVTRSLMLAELEVKDSIRLQEQGLGDMQKTGFGLFIPHKGIAPVVSDDD